MCVCVCVFMCVCVCVYVCVCVCVCVCYAQLPSFQIWIFDLEKKKHKWNSNALEKLYFGAAISQSPSTSVLLGRPSAHLMRSQVSTQEWTDPYQYIIIINYVCCVIKIFKKFSFIVSSFHCIWFGFVGITSFVCQIVRLIAVWWRDQSSM